jgi:hypothetical protein
VLSGAIRTLGARSLSGPTLASEIIKRWFTRRRPNPPRSVRIVLEVNGKTFVDISSKLALAMVDCEYGKPVVMDCTLPKGHGLSHVVTITFSEGE